MRIAAIFATTSKISLVSRPADFATRADRAFSANISFPSVSLATASANPVPRTSTSFTTMLAKCENKSVTEETDERSPLPDCYVRRGQQTELTEHRDRVHHVPQFRVLPTLESDHVHMRHAHSPSGGWDHHRAADRQQRRTQCAGLRPGHD